MINQNIKKDRYKITVVGSGYVGMSLSVLLSQKNDVTVLDIDKSVLRRLMQVNLQLLI